MAIKLSDIQALIDRVNEYRDPQIRFYGCNGLLYIITKDTGAPVGPSMGANKHDTYWFLRGLLSGVGADHLNAKERKKAFDKHSMYLDAADHLMDYICYENTVDDSGELDEFVRVYGCEPDEFLNPDSARYILGRMIFRFEAADGKKLTHSKQQTLWQTVVEEVLLEEMKRNA